MELDFQTGKKMSPFEETIRRGIFPAIFFQAMKFYYVFLSAAKIHFSCLEIFADTLMAHVAQIITTRRIKLVRSEFTNYYNFWLPYKKKKIRSFLKE